MRLSVRQPDREMHYSEDRAGPGERQTCIDLWPGPPTETSGRLAPNPSYVLRISTRILGMEQTTMMMLGIDDSRCCMMGDSRTGVDGSQTRLPPLLSIS